MFWIWKEDIVSDDQAILDTRPQSIRRNGWYFDDGLLVEIPEQARPIDIEFEGEDDGYLTDNIAGAALPGLLVSSKLRHTLESSGVDNIQYIPARVLHHNGKASEREYFIANIIGRIACIDADRSELVHVPGPPPVVDSISRLRLDENKLRDCLVFRLGELPIVVVVAGSVKDAVERSNATGVRFSPADDFFF